MLKQSILAGAVLMTAVSGVALAEDDMCNVPEADRQPIEALQSKLESEGWTVKNIKVDEGCYEAYATNAEGKRMETYFDPKTFEVVEEKGD